MRHLTVLLSIFLYSNLIISKVLCNSDLNLSPHSSFFKNKEGGNLQKFYEDNILTNINFDTTLDIIYKDHKCKEIGNKLISPGKRRDIVKSETLEYKLRALGHSGATSDDGYLIRNCNALNLLIKYHDQVKNPDQPCPLEKSSADPLIKSIKPVVDTLTKCETNIRDELKKIISKNSFTEMNCKLTELTSVFNKICTTTNLQSPLQVECSKKKYNITFSENRYFFDEIFPLGNGHVKQAQFFLKKDGDQFTPFVKLVPAKDAKSEELIKAITNETLILGKLTSVPNIIKPYDTFDGGYVQPFYTNIRSVSDPYTLINPLLITIEKMHELGYAHRDIKPDNVLSTLDGKPVLADFDMAKHFDSDTSTHRWGGTSKFMDPQDLNNGQCLTDGFSHNFTSAKRGDMYGLALIPLLNKFENEINDYLKLIKELYDYCNPKDRSKIRTEEEFTKKWSTIVAEHARLIGKFGNDKKAKDLWAFLAPGRSERTLDELKVILK